MGRIPVSWVNMSGSFCLQLTLHKAMQYILKHLKHPVWLHGPSWWVLLQYWGVFYILNLPICIVTVKLGSPMCFVFTVKLGSPMCCVLTVKLGSPMCFVFTVKLGSLMCFVFTAKLGSPMCFVFTLYTSAIIHRESVFWLDISGNMVAHSYMAACLRWCDLTCK